MQGKQSGWASEATEEGPALPKTVTLYQRHMNIVEYVARSERRTFSNALQMIIEQHYDAHVEDFPIQE